VAAQPFNLEKRLEAPREVDEDLNEFWVENPFDFEREGGFNLSMYERNRFFVNQGAGKLVDASHISGVDVDFDSRSVAVGDLDEDGRPDMLLRSVGGGPLRVFLNNMVGGQSITVTLQGHGSNTEGIGTRLALEVDGRRLYREHFPKNSLMAQSATETIFGLGDAEGPFRLTVSWPSGVEQVLDDVRPGRLLVTEPVE
jgi:hypothetical protein